MIDIDSQGRYIILATLTDLTRPLINNSDIIKILHKTSYIHTLKISKPTYTHTYHQPSKYKTTGTGEWITNVLLVNIVITFFRLHLLRRRGQRRRRGKQPERLQINNITNEISLP